MIRLTSVVLPAPVGPTIATVWPGSATSDRSSISGSSGVVAERHVLERAPRPRPPTASGVGRLGRLLLGVEQLEDPLGRGDAGLQQVGHRRDLGQRLGELPGVLDERLHVAEDIVPGGHPQAADHRDHDVVEVPDEHHRRHDQPGDELRAEAGLVQLVVLAPRTPRSTSVLPAEHLDQRVPGEGLLDVRVELAGAPPLRDEHASASACAISRGDHHRQRHGDQRDRAPAAARSRTSSPARRRR